MLSWSIHRGEGNVHQLAVSDLVSKPGAFVKTSEELSNGNAKNIFIKIYSPGNKIGKTYSKHSDEEKMEWGLAAQGEMALHYWSSVKYTELHPSETSGYSHSVLIPPWCWILTPRSHIILITRLWGKCCYLFPFHRLMSWCSEKFSNIWNWQLGTTGLGLKPRTSQAVRVLLTLMSACLVGQKSLSGHFVGVQLPRTTRQNCGYKYKACGWSMHLELLEKTLTSS